jgi:hypothetical protein
MSFQLGRRSGRILAALIAAMFSLAFGQSAWAVCTNNAVNNNAQPTIQIGDIYCIGETTGSVTVADTTIQSYSYTFTAGANSNAVVFLFRNDQGITNLSNVSLTTGGGGNLLTNGDFSGTTYTVGSQTIPTGWNLVGTPGLTAGGTYNDAMTSGSGLVAWADGAVAGFDGLSQNVSLVNGQSYTLTFQLWINFNGGGGSQATTLSTAGQSQGQNIGETLIYSQLPTGFSQSNDATLSSLALSSGTLSPSFASGTTSYTASVTNATSSITVTPTTTDGTATVKVNGTTVTSGSASGNISLNVGANTITTVVTAGDGTTTQTYTVTVTRASAGPTVTSISPSSALTTASTNVTITGTGFTNSSTAKLGTYSLTFVSQTGGTSLVMTVPTRATSGLTAGTAYDITVTESGNTSSTSASDQFTYNKVTQTISALANPGTQTYAATPTLAATTATSGLAVSYGSSTASVCTINSGTRAITLVAPGTCTLTADQAGDSDYAAATQVTTTFTVNKASQTISALTNPGTQVFGTTPTLAATTSTSGLTISYGTSTAGVCTINSGTRVLTFVSAGTCTVTADQAGDTNYNAATQVTTTFTVSQASQTITFNAPGNQTFGTSPTIAATASSGLAIAFASTTTSVCTINASTGVLTTVAAGTCTITADQAGNTNYAAATQVSQTFNITQASQTITFNAPGNKVFGTSPTISASASSGLTIAFASTTTSVCTINASTGVLTTVAVGTCTITADQAGNTNYAAATQASQTFSITQASQTITFAQPNTQATGSSVTTLTATSTSGLSVTFTSATTGVCTITSGGVLTGVTAGSCTINADQAGNANYAAASQVQRTFNIAAPTVITFANPGSQTFNTTPTLTASADSGLAIAWSSSTTGVCTINATTGVLTTVIVGSCTINADQAGDATHAQATTVSQTFSITKAAQTITFANPGAQTFGTSPTLTATGGASGNNVTFTSSTTGICTVTSGGVLTTVAVGTCTINADQASSGNYNAATTVSRSFAINQASQTITFNAPGNKTFGTSPTIAASASSGLAIAFASTTTSVCTINASTGVLTTVAVGSCTITADQAGNANYTAATQASQTFNITQASQTITFNAPGNKVFGTSPTISASASSGLAIAYASTTASVCTINASTGVLTTVAVGSCTITADQAGNTNYAAATQASQTFNITQASQTITFSNPGTVLINASPTLSASASSSLTVAFTSATTGVCTITTGGALTPVAAGTCTISANQAGNANYAAATQVQQSFSISLAPQTITLNAPSSLIVGGSGSVTATSSSSLTVTVSSTTTGICTYAAGSVTAVAAGTCTLSASQA